MGQKKIAGERIFNNLAALMKSLLCIPHSNAFSKGTFSMVRKTVTENRTRFAQWHCVRASNRKLNCDCSAAGFKPFKVGLNAAKKATYKHNQAHKN